MEFPILVVNFKNYPEGQGRNGVELAKSLDRASRELGKPVAIAPPAPILMKVAEVVEVPVLAQHVDPVPASSTTGFLPPEAVKEAGCIGSIVNHSEHKLQREEVLKVVRRLHELGMFALICASTPEEAASLATFGPDSIALEPPELIGTGIAVSKARPELIVEGVKAVRSVNKNIRVLCGAGISSGEDVTRALKLGAEGVLVASAILKARSPYDKACEILRNL